MMESNNIYSSYLISSGIPNKSHINQYDGREYTSLEGTNGTNRYS